MAYIPLHRSVTSHWKTDLAAELLGLPVAHTVGHLCCLWTWAIDNAPDGNLTKIPPRAIARGALYPGDPELFIRALTEAKFLDEAPLRIHDWAEYALGLMEATDRARVLNAERQKRWRDRHKSPDDERNDETVTNNAPQDQKVTAEPITENDRNASVTLRNANRGEETRGEETNLEDSSSSPGGEHAPESDDSAPEAEAASTEKKSTPPKPKPSPTLARLNGYRQELMGWPKIHPLNPAAITESEQLLEEVGEDRFREGLAWLCARGEHDMGKAGRWARTKMRGSNNGTGATRGVVQNGEHSGRANGAGSRSNGGGGQGDLAAGQFAYYHRPYSPGPSAGSQAGGDPKPL